MSKTLILLHGEVKTPPVSLEARREIGLLLRDLQEGKTLTLPQSRPMPTVGKGCHELRVIDSDRNWRVMYYIATDEIVILDVFDKDTQTTPRGIIDTCKARLTAYQAQKLAEANAKKKTKEK